MHVVSGDKYDAMFPVESLLTRNEREDIHDYKANYWLAPDNAQGSFILNLGCEQIFRGVRLVNTHNRWAKDRATKHFR